MKYKKETKMSRTRWSIGGVAIAAAIAVAGMSAVPAQAQQYTLINTCADNFTCTEDPPVDCWCEIDWDTEGQWQLCILWEGSCATYEDPPMSFPDASTDIVIIEHSTTDSRCWKGIDHGNTCNDDDDCRITCYNPGGNHDGASCVGTKEAAKCVAAGGTCVDHDCEPEQYLLINLTKDAGDPDAEPPVPPAPITIKSLTIKPESNGTLDIKFESGNEPLDDPQVSEVLTVAYTLTFGGTSGGVVVSVADSAVLKTDTSE